MSEVPLYASRSHWMQSRRVRSYWACFIQLAVVEVYCGGTRSRSVGMAPAIHSTPLAACQSFQHSSPAATLAKNLPSGDTSTLMKRGSMVMKREFALGRSLSG